MSRRVTRSDEGVAPTVGAIGLLVLIVGFFQLAVRTDADVWVPMLIVTGLTAIGAFICTRLARGDTRLLKILLLALCLKMASVGPRYWVNEVFYQGNGDAGRYDQAGDFFLKNLRQGEWSLEGAELMSFPQETRTIGYIAGTAYIFVGTTYLGGYMIFAFYSWIGIVLFFRAFRLAYPNAPPYLAAKLLFFFPSMLFWPSSIGKDAILVLSLGALTYGATKLFLGKGIISGVLYALAGGYMISLVRPHILIIALAAVGAALLARRTETSGSSEASKSQHARAVATRLLLLALLVPAISFGLGRMDELYGESGGGIDVESTLDSTKDATEIGNSSFQAQPVRSPLDLPGATLTVLFRPFIFEATSVPVLISALEGTVLLGYCFASARWIWRVGPAMYRGAFAAFAGVFVLAFVAAFSNISNAGILSRQRVQMFPLLLLLIAAAAEHFRGEQEALALASPPSPEPLAGLPARSSGFRPTTFDRPEKVHLPLP